ncbi:hypothetical protein TSACC_2792 [Terrimicrobium sacchariphilum]|uniref:Uncharacterized protein n=1 Tax=Terrimicrobium sacchariphilum TaxID=690879 RepID=A0A146G603_TERSA|nr:hypothetical protein [Terrimicrobium sacchariphilum]GAT32394.1 hypothetical protein TSACC_2792 [Terrimicrobium sacchariphilum]
MRNRVLVSLAAVCLGWGAGLGGARGDDLARDVERAEVIFTASYDRDRDPQLRVEQVLFCVEPPLGQIALTQGMDTLLYRLRQYFPESSGGMQRYVVFARMPKGDASWRVPFAMVREYGLDDGRFCVSRNEHTVAELLRFIEKRKKADGV